MTAIERATLAMAEAAAQIHRANIDRAQRNLYAIDCGDEADDYRRIQGIAHTTQKLNRLNAEYGVK